MASAAILILQSFAATVIENVHELTQIRWMN